MPNTSKGLEVSVFTMVNLQDKCDCLELGLGSFIFVTQGKDSA